MISADCRVVLHFQHGSSDTFQTFGTALRRIVIRPAEIDKLRIFLTPAISALPRESRALRDVAFGYFL